MKASHYNVVTALHFTLLEVKIIRLPVKCKLTMYTVDACACLCVCVVLYTPFPLTPKAIRLLLLCCNGIIWEWERNIKVEMLIYPLVT